MNIIAWYLNLENCMMLNNLKISGFITMHTFSCAESDCIPNMMYTQIKDEIVRHFSDSHFITTAYSIAIRDFCKMYHSTLATSVISRTNVMSPFQS